MKNYELTIGISAMANNLLPLVDYCVRMCSFLDEKVCFLICVQGTQYERFEFKLNGRVSIIFSNSKGLSHSRNIILENNKSPWLWVQDDDIRLDTLAVNELISDINEVKSDLIFAKIRSSENNNPYKNYNFHNKHTRLNSFKISSIEIIIRRNFYIKNGLKFDTNIGLGTNLPSGEENMFLWDCFSLSNNVLYKNVFVCEHTTLAENRNIDYHGRFKAKGYILKKLPKLIALPLFFRWVLRSASISFISRLKLMIYGYRVGS